jgi:HAE1 family hydrophobic/amphiphilic exporter-1
MNIPRLAVNRPIFTTCLVILVIFAGWQSLQSLPVDFFPKVDIPFVTITTLYPGAGPKEVEAGITKRIEDEIATLEGVKQIRSSSQDALSVVTVEFRMGLPIDTLEQRLRDRIAIARVGFPKDVQESVVERFNAADQPVITIFLSVKKQTRMELTDWVDLQLKPLLSRIAKVGRVEILGGLKREIKIVANPKKLENFRMPLLSISQALQLGDVNVPGGSLAEGGEEVRLRSLGQFETFADIGNRIISFGNAERPVRVRDIGTVIDSSEKERSRAFYRGQQGVVLQIYKQSGANTVAVARDIVAEIERLKATEPSTANLNLTVVRDGAKLIKENVADVWESIALGVLFTTLVVYLFLGSFRSTVITGIAIPNSIFGAFILMGIAGFSINILTLLALSLCVGLLVDDAIVVRENIFKKLEMGLAPPLAAINGATEVAMAVIAVTLAILAMFGPVAFLQGLTGQFLKEFGLVVCFAIVISLFDAMAVAPMLSAYWADKNVSSVKSRKNPFHLCVLWVREFQDNLEVFYQRVLYALMKRPLLAVFGVVFSASLIAAPVFWLPSGFLPTDESDEFNVKILMPPGSNLDATTEVAELINRHLEKSEFIDHTILIVGNSEREISLANILVKLKDRKIRGAQKPSQLRDTVREELRHLPGLPSNAEILVAKLDVFGGDTRAFNLIIQTTELRDLKPLADRVYKRIKGHTALTSPTLEMKTGGHELQIDMNTDEAHRLGISPTIAVLEIRGRIEGFEVGKLRAQDQEYKIKLTTADTAETWFKRDKAILVPNVNMTPVDLRRIAKFSTEVSPSKLERLNRNYAANISGDLASGASLSNLLDDVNRIMAAEIQANPAVRYSFEGDSESYNELVQSMGKALLFGLVFLFLVLASLYESFLIAFLNIFALPLAVSGAFLALAIFNESLNLFSIIGILLLLGVATKNSILLVDTASQRLKASANKDSLDDIAFACVRRLRPILMTSFALIAGTIPNAIGLNEVSAQRRSMGLAIIGGTVTSTLFTLLLVPAMLLLVERLREKKFSSTPKN